MWVNCKLQVIYLEYQIFRYIYITEIHVNSRILKMYYFRNNTVPMKPLMCVSALKLQEKVYI